MQRGSKEGPRIYVVLPVHNRLSITRKFIEHLKRQTYNNYHLVLVDDGSTDGTAEYVKSRIDNLTVLHGNGNLWWAGALTKAYRYLSRIDADDDDLVWINNDDSIFEPDYFETIVNDRALKPKTLVISPGHCLHTDFIERGFAIDWSKVQFHKLKEGEKPDCLTTRGLYMLFSTYKALGGLHPWLVPHYLSDLEYTIRAKRRGYSLVISESSRIYVDRTTTGSHKQQSKTVRQYLYDHFISKKTAFSTFYWGNFVLLAAPWGYKLRSLADVYRRFFKGLNRNFIKKPKTSH